jgi:hypothetical protein
MKGKFVISFSEDLAKIFLTLHNWLIVVQITIKLDLRGCKTIPGHFFKNTFSRRSRKPPNPYPTLTQRHRSPYERPTTWVGP